MSFFDKSIDEYFSEGVTRLQADGDAAEVTKVGTLRAGNSGHVDSKGIISGKCAALTYLRMKGVRVEEADNSRELMFDGGRGNEDLWVAVLKKSSFPGIILREEQVAIEWHTAGGIKVTGRPDIVLCSDRKVDWNVTLEPGEILMADSRTAETGIAAKPERGIELKLVSSVWTARDILLDKPKAMHILQAAHYAWKLGVPFELWYTSRADFAVMGWATRHFPQPGERGSESCQYTEKKVADADGIERSFPEIRKVLPFRKGFEIRIDEQGRVLYRPMDRKGWVQSYVTVQGIEKYYELVSQLEQTGKVPPETVNLLADGDKANWKLKDYCPLGSNCCAVTSEKRLDVWLGNVIASLESQRQGVDGTNNNAREGTEKNNGK